MSLSGNLVIELFDVGDTVILEDSNNLNKNVK